MRFETCHRLKIPGEFWSNPSVEMLSNINAEPTTDSLDKICFTVPTEENGVEERPQFVPVSFFENKILSLSCITITVISKILTINYEALLFSLYISTTLLQISTVRVPSLRLIL